MPIVYLPFTWPRSMEIEGCKGLEDVLYHLRNALFWVLLCTVLSPLKQRAYAGAALNVKDAAKLQQPLNEFVYLDENALLEAYGIPKDAAYEKAYKTLRAHFVGTQREKTRVKKECDKKFNDVEEFGAPTADNIGCLYWQLQRLVKEEKATAEPSRKKEPTPKPKVVKTKLKKFNEVKKAFDVVMKQKNDCEYLTDRVILFRTSEEYLPEPEAWQLMNQLYEASLDCIVPSSPHYEVLHTRMALLSLERNDVIRAAKYLDLALNTVRPSEEYRTLFWRGLVEALPYADEKTGLYRSHRNVYWDRLGEEYPLTLHAIVADAATNRDFISRIRDRAPPKVAQVHGKEWNLYNYTAFVFGLFSANNEKEGLRRISMYATNRVTPPNFEATLYLAHGHFRAGQNWGGIATVFSGLKDFGNAQITIDVMRLLYPLPYKEHILSAGKFVDPALIFALIRQESTFNARAQSPVGAKGLMQVLDSTARHVMKKKVNLFDPHENVQAGAKYLKQLLKRNSDRPPAALASYNAGPTHVARWRNRYTTTTILLFSDLIPFPETRNYIAGITRNMYWYQVFLNWEQAQKGEFSAHRFGEEGLTAVAFVPSAASFGVKPSSSTNIVLERFFQNDGDL